MSDTESRSGWQWASAPDTSEWPVRLRALQGEFGRPSGFHVTSFVMLAVWTGATLLAVAFLWNLVSDLQHPPGMNVMLAVFVGFCIFVMAKAWRGVGLKYVVRGGTISAVGTNGRELWTESLDQLQAVRYQRQRGAVRLTLVWSDREREMLGIQSLVDALQAAGRGERSVP